ncbi:hypothetical protein E2C01_013246 [Portunus trituberculatus]|uniref:SMB domain-containing protein n=1 Tax=Portunus trituberculatus TaxID=210409 RepID=A0A5B7DGK6_PORTR|nr:hypothetical protein [Portunus trituberculatus]
MLPQVRRARHCFPSAMCAMLTMLVPVSLQIESRWGVEYPVVPWEDMWQEMEMMAVGKNCPTEISTCWHTANETIAQALVPQVCRPCACDEECVRYGDCCRDKAQADWGDGREEGTGRYNCGRLRPWDYQGLLMVGSCLPEYRDHPVERLCTQKVPPEEYTYFLDLSVTSKLTNTTYTNYHCAVCNNDASSLHAHTVTINCRTTQMAEFTEPEKFAEKYGGRLCMYPKSGCPPNLLGRKAHCKQQYVSLHHKLASDVPLLPQDQASSQPKTNKPNVQRVMSLLHQLQQQSQSSVDLPDLVQQLLKRSGDSFKGTDQNPGTLSKCRSFTEGTCPEIKDEQQRALVAQLRSMAAGSFRAEMGNHGPPKTSSAHHQPSSLNHTANTSYNSLYTPSKSLPPQMSADNGPAIASPQLIKRSQNSFNHLQRTPKSQ